MSEHDTSWSSGVPGDREADSVGERGAGGAGRVAEPGAGGAGEAPRHQHEQRDTTSEWAAPRSYPAPTGSAAPTSSAGSAHEPPGAPDPPTVSYPGTSYQGGAYQPGTTGSFPTYQSAGSYQPPYPSQPYQPGGPTWTATHAEPPRSNARLLRGGVLLVAAVGLALCSGLAGGFLVHSMDKAQPVTTVTRNAAPVLDRKSVASVAAKVQPSVVDISTGEGEGSGVVLSADGSILTNNHVIEGARGNTVKVTFSDGKTATATIVGTDPAGDLAVIKAQNVSGLSAATFGNSDDLQVGDTVLALGSPLGLQGSVTAGIVSALHRTIDEGGQGVARHSIPEAIQTDAAINPGNSGGALVNLAGEVVGINTAIATNGTGNGNIGVGFAISSNRAKSTADQLLKGGKVSHPYLGVQVSDGQDGALLADVVAGGPADKAGLKRGDLVTKVGSKVVTDSQSLVAAVQAGKPGDQVQITIKRDGAEQQVTVTLGESS